jgi:ABC-type amino acid transport substrate-binding protein
MAKGKTVRLFFLTCLLMIVSSAAFAGEKESAYDRVMRTGVLRCGYALSASTLHQDLKTGAITGLIPDVITEAAESLGLKVEWVTEVGYADFAEGLKSGRYDAFCSSISPTAPRARVAKFTTPIYGVVVNAYVRTSETRFTKLDDINKPDVRAGDTDGEIFQKLTRQFFPNAKEVSQPNMGSSSQLFLDLIDKKTDVVVIDAYTASDFLRNNPGKVAPALKAPIQIIPSAFAVGAKEGDLRDLLNTALFQMQNTGRLNSILDNHKIGNAIFYRARGLFDDAP